MNLPKNNYALIEKLPDTFNNGIEMSFLRIDKLDKFFGGNKWFKLKYNIEYALAHNYSTVLTFGGAYSNHIYSTAAACKQFGLKSIGVIRGEEPKEYSSTLNFAQEYGMQLEFISREDYKSKESPSILKKLKDKFGDFYLIPEGGSNQLGVKGCTEILSIETTEFDYICCACGTGATLAGLALSAAAHQKVIGFPVLKGAADFMKHVDVFIDENIAGAEAISVKNKIQLFTDYHFGGYAKTTPALFEFMDSFQKTYNLELDQVYTSKMTFGVLGLIVKKHFPPNSKILLIHTGGLQGNMYFDI